MKNEGFFLKKLKTEETPLNTIKAKKFFFSFRPHQTPRLNNEKNILEGKAERRRQRDRPRAQWCDNIKEWSEHSLVKCTRLANQREVWYQISSQPGGARTAQ